MEACLNTAGECRRCDADEVPATVAGIRCRTHTDARVRSVQVASQIQKVIHGDSYQHENVPRSQDKQSPAKNCDNRVRRYNACIRALREHPMHTNADVDMTAPSTPTLRNWNVNDLARKSAGAVKSTI